MAPGARPTGGKSGQPFAADEGDLGPLTGVWSIGGPEYLGLRMALVTKVMDRYLYRQLAQWGLTLAEWRVIAQLAAKENSSVSELARQAWVDKAEVSRAVASLQKAGLVERHAYPPDRRSPRFSINAAGRQKYDDFQPTWRALLRTIIQPCSEAELEQMNARMAQIARLLLDLNDDFKPASP